MRTFRSASARFGEPGRKDTSFARGTMRRTHASLPGAIGDPSPVSVAWVQCAVDEPWILSTVTFDDGDSKPTAAQEISFGRPDCLPTEQWDTTIATVTDSDL